MYDAQLRCENWRYALACAVVIGLTGGARGDGGSVQTSQTVGKYRVTIFTSPNPLRAGPVDVSVWVQNAATGATLPEARVDLELLSPQGIAQRVRATHEAATNKLFCAALLDAPSPGTWPLQAEVSGELGSGRLACQLAVAEPLPKWRSMWIWYSWPLAVVLLFVWRQLTRKSARGRTLFAGGAHFSQ